MRDLTDRQWCERMAERNTRAARIAKMRKVPRVPRQRGLDLADVGLAVLFCLVAMAPFMFGFAAYWALR